MKSSIRHTARQIMTADPDITRGGAVRMAAALPSDVDVAGCEYWLVAGETVIVCPGWVADDGQVEVDYPVADTGLEAAEDFVGDGDWGDTGGGCVVVTVWRRAYGSDGVECRVAEDWHSVPIQPEEPPCRDGEDHDWQSPYNVVDGIRDNPGVWGHGGGAVILMVCAHCGQYRQRDTWADDGMGGVYESVEYSDADERSLAWLARRAAREVKAALSGVAEVQWDDAHAPRIGRIVDYAPASDDDAYATSDDTDRTAPGTPWDEECDSRLDDVRAALPQGWAADWSDDDIRIEWEGEPITKLKTLR